MTLQSDRAGNTMAIELFAKRTRPRCHFPGGSDARVVMSGEEAALLRLWLQRNVQTKAQRSVGVITGELRHSRANTAKSSTAQTRSLRFIGCKYSRATNKARPQPN
jgi:hypothetical protein